MTMMRLSGAWISAQRSAGTRSVVGFEVDLGYSPNFFEDTAGDRNFEFGDSNVTTIMGNVLLSAPPGGGVRPYASAGLGLIRANVSSGTGLFNDLSTNDLGVNIGGGLNALVQRQRRHARRHALLPLAAGQRIRQRSRSVARQLRFLARHASA